MMRAAVSKYLILLFFICLLPLAGFAQDSDLGGEEVLTEELPVAEIFSKPDQEEVRIKDKVYLISNEGIQPEWIANYKDLSDQQKESFQQNRRLFLVGIARVLSRVSLPIGVGGIVKDKLVWVKDSIVAKFKKSKNPVEDSNAEETITEKGWKERADILTKNILNGVNRSLWARAPLVSHSNEFGVVLGAGLAIEGGVATKGWGGLYDLGISFGFNKETKSLVFQIFRNQEKYASTIMGAVFYAGTVGKAGIYVAENSGTKAVAPKHGTSFYPPAFPGFSTDTSHSFTSGMSSGFGWPPPPLGDMLTYSNSHEQQVIVRLSVSPAIPGFIRLNFGKGRGPLALLQPIEDLLHFIHSYLIRAPVCNGAMLGS